MASKPHLFLLPAHWPLPSLLWLYSWDELHDHRLLDDHREDVIVYIAIMYVMPMEHDYVWNYSTLGLISINSV